MFKIISTDNAWCHRLELSRYGDLYTIVAYSSIKDGGLTIYLETSKQRAMGVLQLLMANKEVFLTMKHQALNLSERARKELWENKSREAS